MRDLFKRLTWGFLPEGWRRIVLILLLVVGTYYMNEEFPEKQYYWLDGRQQSLTYIRELGFEDILLSVIALMLLSLIASWIANGFTKE